MHTESRWLITGFCIYACLTLTSMASMSIGVVLLLIIIGFGGIGRFWTELRSELKHPVLKVYLWLSVCLALVCILSLIFASFFPLQYWNKTVEVNFLKDIAKLWYLFLPLILVVGLRRVPEGKRFIILKAWLIAFYVLGIIGIIQHFTGWPRHQEIPGLGLSSPRFHANLLMGHHLSVASAFIFPFFATLDLAARWNGPGYVRMNPWFLWLSALFGGVMLFFTWSRILWIALPIGLLVWILWVIPRRLAVITALLLVVLGAGVYQIPSVQVRLNQQLGVGTRMDLWQANWEFAKQRPLTGVGWRKNQELSGYYLLEKTKAEHVFSGHAHNNLLDMLGGTGFPGTFVWLVWCGGVFWILWQSARKSPPVGFSVGLFCAWIVFHINGLTQVNVWDAKVQHQMMWVIAWSLLWASQISAKGKDEERV